MPPEKLLQDLYYCLQDKGESINFDLQRFKAMVTLIPNVTDKLAAHHFKTFILSKASS